MAPSNYRFEIGESLGAPRLVVAGLSGDSGKTLVSIALLLALRERAIEVRAFKKGPDYIDAAWLSWAAGHPARHLDTWLFGFDEARDEFVSHATSEGLNLVEGNRGLFDGVDTEGTHSTAQLARTLQAPVLLVVDASKATRTLAALVLGCQALERDLDIRGVILNRVAGGRHESVARAAIEHNCGVRVLGAIPRFEVNDLPGRQLGLVTPGEHEAIGRVKALALDAANHMDVDACLAMASAQPMAAPSGRMPRIAPPDATEAAPAPGRPAPRGPTIAYVLDSAFSFYYPANLEALEEAGAILVPVSSLADAGLPPGADALYIGGGFPETHAPRLAANRPFLESVRAAADNSLPIYAECGGLMLLARAIRMQGERHPMAGVLPFEVEMSRRPQGHGYATLQVDQPNPFFPVGATLKGHEFHYSSIADEGTGHPIGAITACGVDRGTGCGSGRDAVIVNNVWASYVHVHAASAPGWASGLVRAASRFRDREERVS